MWGKGVPWLSIADMSQGNEITHTKEQVTQLGAAKGKLISPGTVLLSFKLSIGKVAIAKIPMLTNEAIAALPIKDPSRLNNRYLLRILETMDLAARSNRAAMGATLNKAKLRSIRIPLPPLDEQRRIAAILDQVDAIRTKRRRMLDDVEPLIHSVYDSMFGNLPLDTPLSLVCSRITDGTHQSPEWEDHGIPFLFISNITSGEINLESDRSISEKTWAKLMEHAMIETGDVLYSTVGSYGIPAVVRTSKPFAFQRHIAHIKPEQKLIDSDFLAVQLSSPALQRQASSVARGIAQPTINLRDIKNFHIAVPSRRHQEQFTSIVRHINAQRSRVEAALARDDELFASLQSRAFKGEL